MATKLTRKKIDNRNLNGSEPLEIKLPTDLNGYVTRGQLKREAKKTPITLEGFKIKVISRKYNSKYSNEYNHYKKGR
jgi:hypothetical protein